MAFLLSCDTKTRLIIYLFRSSMSMSPPRPMSSYMPSTSSKRTSIIPKLDLKQKFSAPPIPPKSFDFPLQSPASFNLLEDDKVYENKNLEKIQSPRKVGCTL